MRGGGVPRARSHPWGMSKRAADAVPSAAPGSPKHARIEAASNGASAAGVDRNGAGAGAPAHARAPAPPAAGVLAQAIEEAGLALRHLSDVARQISGDAWAEAGVDRCRQFLIEGAEAGQAVQRHLEPLIPAGQKTSRMCYLKTLSEAFERPLHVDGAYVREWDAMCKETNEARSYEEIQTKFNISIEERVQHGWEREHAIHYVVLSSIHARGPMAKALGREPPSSKYAHSAYALMNALHSRIGVSFPVSPDPRSVDGDDHPARFYRNLTGSGSLADDDQQWHSIEKPDGTGFRGMTTHAVLRPMRVLHHFDRGGWKPQFTTNDYRLEAGQHDVVAFDNLPTDDHGFHHGISVSEVGTSVAYPPYTLVRLKAVFKAGEWTAPVACLKWKNIGSAKPGRGREIKCSNLEDALRTKSASDEEGSTEEVTFAESELKQLDVRVDERAPSLHHHDFIKVDAAYWQPNVEEIRPNCRLLLVGATYKFPEPQFSRLRATHKLCEESMSLSYGARQTYIDGLTDILHKPILVRARPLRHPRCALAHARHEFSAIECVLLL